MPTTDQSIDSVGVLLVTIHRDERGVFSTSVEVLSRSPDMARATSLPAYASELIQDGETFAAPTPRAARAARWRYLVAAAAVAALAGATLALHSPSRASDPLTSAALPAPTTSPKAFTLSSASCPGTGGSACSDTNGVLPGLDAACTDLLTTAARALDEDPSQWAQRLLVTTVHTGKPFADVIRQWLAGTRADVLATRYADVNLESILQGIDSALALVDTGACSPRTAITSSPVEAAWTYP